MEKNKNHEPSNYYGLTSLLSPSVSQTQISSQHSVPEHP